MSSSHRVVHQRRRKHMFGVLPICLLLSMLATMTTTPSECLALNKNTLEMVNTGLKAIIGINRLIHTIKSVHELSQQALPHLVKPNRSKFLQKLFGKVAQSKSPSSTAPVQTKRSPTLGMIKIGEKPPPGLFPESVPFSMSVPMEPGFAEAYKLAGFKDNKFQEEQINRQFSAVSPTSFEVLGTSTSEGLGMVDDFKSSYEMIPYNEPSQHNEAYSYESI